MGITWPLAAWQVHETPRLSAKLSSYNAFKTARLHEAGGYNQEPAGQDCLELFQLEFEGREFQRVTHSQRRLLPAAAPIGRLGRPGDQQQLVRKIAKTKLWAPTRQVTAQRGKRVVHKHRKKSFSIHRTHVCEQFCFLHARHQQIPARRHSVMQNGVAGSGTRKKSQQARLC